MAEDVFSILESELCILSERLAEEGIRLIVAGGVGLLLRDKHIAETEARTLRAYPRLRATTDIDLVLSTEIISDPSKTEAIRRTLDDLGYEPIETAKFYQFSRPLEEGKPLEDIKVDLLAPTVGRENVRIKQRRIRPRGYNKLHAHASPEALTVEDYLTSIDLPGRGSTATVFLPHPFSYIILKLFAFRDRREDESKDYGRYHAFDIYISLAMMTEEQFEQGRELLERYGESEELEEARRIAKTFFSGPNDLGILRIREHMRQARIEDTAVDLDAFRSDLEELLG